MATKFEPWLCDGPRRISINSFGYGGSNAHAVLEDTEGFLAAYRHAKAGPKLVNGLSATNGINGIYGTNGAVAHRTLCLDSHCESVQDRHRLFVLSGFDQETVTKQARSLANYLRSQPVEGADLDNLAYTLSERRSRLAWKCAVVAKSSVELIEALEVPDFRPVKSSERATIGFIFTGQGAQWPGMGSELMAFPAYRDSLRKAGETIKELGASWDLTGIYHQPSFDSIQLSDNLTSVLMQRKFSNK